MRFPRQDVPGSVLVAWAAVSEEESRRVDWPGRTVEIPFRHRDSEILAISSVPNGETALKRSPDDLVFEKTPVVVRNGVASIVVGTTPVYLVEN